MGGRVRNAACWVTVIASVVTNLCRATETARPDRGGLASAEICGRCHRDILVAWKSSLHARAMDDAVFQDSLRDAKSRFGDAVETRCLACHGPTVAVSGDTALQLKVSWEGVTCDFCHSITHVELHDAREPFRLQIGSAKFGPLRGSRSPAHAATFSKVHTQPVVCAGCHDARNEQGLMVISSYTEWQESAYASDRASCLNCHMSPVKGRIVDPKVQRVKDAPINLHQMPGGHSVDQLNKAILGRVATRRNGDELEVQVFVRNRGAGHMVPTGSPLRRLVLSVEVHSGANAPLTAERTFHRVIQDDKGAVLADEADIWVRGARVASDNRLKPNEERVEIFTFHVPRRQPARIQARFLYHYSPLAKPDSGKVSFLTLPAIVAP